jgi:hypothetical protein
MHTVRNPWPVRCAVALSIVMGLAACGSGGTTTFTPTSPSVVPSPTDSGGDGDAISAIDGIYSVTITERDAAEAGVPKGKFSQVVGDYELDLVRGQLAMYFTGVITLDLLRGTYTVDGHELELASEGGPTLHLKWARDGDGLALTLEDTDQPADRTIDEMIFSSHTWSKTA